MLPERKRAGRGLQQRRERSRMVSSGPLLEVIGPYAGGIVTICLEAVRCIVHGYVENHSYYESTDEIKQAAGRQVDAAGAS